jgi:hypothetical protein
LNLGTKVITKPSLGFILSSLNETVFLKKNQIIIFYEMKIKLESGLPSEKNLTGQQAGIKIH